MSDKVDNQRIYDEHWGEWTDMKRYGPASRWERTLLREVLSSIDMKDAVKSVLDVGCGEGTTTAFIAGLFPGAAVKGTDPSDTGIVNADKGYKLPNLEFVCDTDSSLLNDKYDLITCLEVLEHVDDWESLLGRIAGSSQKFIALSFPTGRMRSFEKNIGHFRNFRKGEVEAFLSAKGFRTGLIYHAGFPFYSPIYREICNLANSGINSMTRGEFKWHQRAMASVLFFMFNSLSSRRRLGDHFCGIFIRESHV